MVKLVYLAVLCGLIIDWGDCCKVVCWGGVIWLVITVCLESLTGIEFDCYLQHSCKDKLKIVAILFG